MFFYWKKVEKKIEELSERIEAIKINEYIELMNNTKKLIWRNFISGLSRGVGIAVGLSIIGAILVLMLQKIVLLNIPVIGDFIADVINIIEKQK
jgi:hypothetical protein